MAPLRKSLLVQTSWHQLFPEPCSRHAPMVRRWHPGCQSKRSVPDERANSAGHRFRSGSPAILRKLRKLFRFGRICRLAAGRRLV